MDMCGGLISKESTLIPINEWMSGGSFDADKYIFRSSKVFEVHAQYSCYLVAKVLDFLVTTGEAQEPSLKSPGRQQQSYSSKWCEIYACLDDWYKYRPPELQAVLSHNAGSISAGSRSPFPTVLFSNGAAIAGNQLYHTAALLMLQRIPPKVPRKSRSFLWHARQICAIAMSNEHHGSWTNSIQPLWLAGQVMSHPDEHQAIIEIYQRIEKETGWGATWRADDLKEYWGDPDD
ncbi:hypothetical protein H2198_005755 [Neophaeococcomyces mojaviensis]|uniref:Uncharacterized protein n=1 Tax=Neophaeococcomyces mojaviensis TaxID=3383035 RepID=A0ACC3A5B8_9EURO|nr:hypothetical protein H2198_005755 [Knufia sp. JES_112]